MDMEMQVAKALRAELNRQAEQDRELRVTDGDEGVTINGRVDLEALAMAVVGSVAGGP